MIKSLQKGDICSNYHLWNKDKLKVNIVNYRMVKNTYSISGAFTYHGINDVLKAAEGVKNIEKIWVIDLMQEFHFFMQEDKENFIPLSIRAKHNHVNKSFYGEILDRHEKTIIKSLKEKHYLEFFTDYKTHEGALNKDKPYTKVKIFYEDLKTEEEMLTSISDKLHYKRFACLDHNPPNTKVLLNFARFLSEEFKPESDWLHFHCHAGKGRSTSFAIIFEILNRVQRGELYAI
jgi:hypothetical protein